MLKETQIHHGLQILVLFPEGVVEVYHLEHFHLGMAVVGELHDLLMVVVVEEYYVLQKEGVEEEGLPDLA